MLVDSFMFYNELDVLELRLTVLDEYVDLFVIVESELNHVGTTKELFFQKNKERFAKWLNKIEHVIVTAEESPKDENPWCREKYQRNCISRGLTNVPKDAVIMISDVDEIPNLSFIPFENLPHLTVSIHMWMFEYSCDYIFTGEPWVGTVMTNLDYFKRYGPNYMRDNRWKFPVIQYGGWHLSSFGDGSHVWNKLRTYAHGKDPERDTETPEILNDYVSNGIHIDGKTKLIPRTPEVPLPGPVEVLRRLNLGTFP
jgi:beta-1,4-mannosyl-glycoprotein beta-1,4-N-acetylglucosaminyltransferase